MDLAQPLVPPCAVITTFGKSMWAIARVKGGEIYSYNGRDHFVPLTGVVCTDDPGAESLDDGVIIDEHELMMISPERGGITPHPTDFLVIRHYAKGHQP